MTGINAVILLINAVSLMLALGFLLIVAWQDAHKALNQFFAFFLLLVTLWNAGALLTQASLLVSFDLVLIQFAISILELGFIGSSIAVYVLTTLLVGAQIRNFRTLALTSLLMVLVYRGLIILINPPSFSIGASAETFSYRFPLVSVIFYAFFDSLTFYMVWRYRRKIRSRTLVFGIILFVIGQTAGFLNPELPVIWVSTSISSIATLLISSAILRQEIIKPLAERVSQVESMHRVSLSITSQIALDTVLDEIARQAVGWLKADGAGIFLQREEELELATVFNLPEEFVHSRVKLGEGVAGTVAKTNQSIRLDDYGRDWRGITDLPLAKETFGSILCVPLMYGGQVIGVVMVIAGRQGRLFGREDVYLLELLAAQAAVAIAHSRLFAEQRNLTQQVEAAHNQLESVLVSTENPVIALDRRFRLIFANPAARKLFSIGEGADDKTITKVLPRRALPPNNQAALSDLRHNRVHIYEISLDSKVYLCHLASIGRPRITGWVAVLNDVTQLKELDRLKSEMVRMTSHDLKNPLQAALANLDLLKEDLAGVINSEEAQLSLNAIEKQLLRMHRIIGGILDLERIKTGALALELSHPSRLIENAIDELQYLATENGITLKAEVADDVPELMCDEEQFGRVLINLVENAIKFTPVDGKVWLSAEKHYGDVLFKVVDTGIGIPMELQARVFERFYRARQKGAEHIAGSGLGLSLVKTIVENHHGRVWLKSEIGQGTTFFVSIPSAREKQNQSKYRVTE